MFCLYWPADMKVSETCVVSITGLWLCTLKKPEPENQRWNVVCLRLFITLCVNLSIEWRGLGIFPLHRNTICTFSLLKGQCHRIPHNSWTFSTIKGTVSLHPTQLLDIFTLKGAVSLHGNTTCTFLLLKGQCHCIPHNSWTFALSKAQCHCIPPSAGTFSQFKG